MSDPAPLTAAELTLKKGYTYKRGEWRNALMRAVERIEAEDGVDGPEPKPVLDRIAYKFVKLCLAAGHEELGFFKELGDRLDGKAPQAIIPQNSDGSPLVVQVVKLSDFAGIASADDSNTE